LTNLRHKTLTLESLDEQFVLAGLLTCSVFGRPSRELVQSLRFKVQPETLNLKPLSQWFEFCPKIFAGTYSSGSVRDFHPVPFSWMLPDGNIQTKTWAKVAKIFNAISHFDGEDCLFLQKIFYTQ